MALADIHIHLLFGVDDGAKDEDEMHAILDAAYQAGTRVLCCTPHFHPGYFGDNYDKVNVAFKRLSSYVQKTYDCISTSNPEDTRILEVTVKADSPELAKRIVDKICTIGSKRIEDAMGFQQVNLYELGTTDPDPCNSTRMLTFAFAGVVAAVVTYVIFLIIFLLDDRIKTDDENLERYLGLSVLGNIPNADGKKPGKYGYYKTYAAYKTSAKQEGEDK